METDRGTSRRFWSKVLRGDWPLGECVAPARRMEEPWLSLAFAEANEESSE